MNNNNDMATEQNSGEVKNIYLTKTKLHIEIKLSTLSEELQKHFVACRRT
jgi:hypothetical protein